LRVGPTDGQRKGFLKHRRSATFRKEVRGGRQNGNQDIKLNMPWTYPNLNIGKKKSYLASEGGAKRRSREKREYRAKNPSNREKKQRRMGERGGERCTALRKEKTAFNPLPQGTVRIRTEIKELRERTKGK